MSQRIIFLDIDGVILPTRMWAAPENLRWLGTSPPQRAPNLAFDPGAVGLLVQLARLTDARFVLHSNWRRRWPDIPEALLEKLVQSGLARELWHAAWSVLNIEGEDKVCEISEWLHAHGSLPCRALIIDDAPLGPVVAASSLEIAQVRPSRDEGFGMAEYRAALGFFGVTDPRIKKSPIAPLWPVERKISIPTITNAFPVASEMSRDEAIAYLQEALERSIPWTEFHAVVATLPDAWVFEAYFPIAAMDARWAPKAALVLLKLGTECPMSCKDAVRALLDRWNPSLEELPWYLAECFGAEKLHATILELSREPLTELQKGRLQVISYFTS